MDGKARCKATQRDISQQVVRAPDADGSHQEMIDLKWRTCSWTKKIRFALSEAQTLKLDKTNEYKPTSKNAII